jgi:hypothetical protein
MNIRVIAALAVIFPSAMSIACSSDPGSAPGPGTDTGASSDDGKDGAILPPAETGAETGAEAGLDGGVDSSIPVDTGPTVPAGCTLIELGQLTFIASRSSTINALFQGPLTTSLGDPSIVDGLNLQVIGMDDSVVNKTGTFELGVGPEANYSTAEHEVLAFEDPTSAGSVRKFFPVSGQLTIDATTPAATAATKGMKGRLSNVKMVEVTIDSTSHVSTPVPGGKCVYIADKVLDIKAP